MSSLLQTGKSRLAHSRLTANAVGPNDLRPLTALINTEKGILTSTTRLSQDTKKAADALREWGSSQGDDLGDILPKVAFLFEQLGKAQATYVEHESTYRLHFKSVRTREENLLALRKSKDSLASRIDSAEKQLNKTSQEHKERSNREQKLFELRQEMVSMENDVMNEEARISDYKRDTTREAMGLKLGAMLELSERQTIIAEMARLLVAEVPTVRTVPGKPRAAYNGYTATEEVMQEAQQCLTSVVFNPVPSNNTAFGDQQTPTQTHFDTSLTSNDDANRTNDFYASASGLPPVLPQMDHQQEKEWPELSRRYSENEAGIGIAVGSPNLAAASQTSFANTSHSDNRSSLAYMEETPDSTPAPHSRIRPVSGSKFADSAPASASELPPSIVLQPVAAQQSMPIPDLPRMPALMQKHTDDTATEIGHESTAAPSTPNVEQTDKQPPSFEQASAKPTAQSPVAQQPNNEVINRPLSNRGSLPMPPSSPRQPSNSYTNAMLSKSQPPSQSQTPSREQNASGMPQSVSQPALAHQTKLGRQPERDPAPAYTYTVAQDARDRLSQSLPSAPPRITALDLMDPPNFKRPGGPSTPTTSTGGRPRGSGRQDSGVVLGSKHGFDDPAYKAETDANNLSQTARPFPPKPTKRDSTGPPAGYSYQPAQKMPAGATRKMTGGSNYSYSINGSSPYPSYHGAPPGPSPAALIREQYLQQQEADEMRRQQSSTSAMAAPAYDGGNDTVDTPPVAPLKSNAPSSPQLPNSLSMPQAINTLPDQTSGGFAGNRYVRFFQVTRLD